MFGRLCILEIIPAAFDAYVPPVGIDVTWHWDFAGKQNENQVAAFFTASEITLDNTAAHTDGDIKQEIQNNRCFVVIRSVPFAEWTTVIPNLNTSGPKISMPTEHPNYKEAWDKKVTARFEAEVDEEAFKAMHKGIDPKKVPKPRPDKIKKDKGDDPKPLKKISLPYASLVDDIRPETD